MVAFVVFDGPDSHGLEVLNFVFGYDKVDIDLDVLLGRGIGLYHVIFLLELSVKYYEHRYKVVILVHLLILYQLYFLYWFSLVVSLYANNVSTRRDPAKLYLCLDKLQKPPLLVYYYLFRVLLTFRYHLHASCYQWPHQVKVKLQITLQHQKVFKIKCQNRVIQKRID